MARKKPAAPRTLRGFVPVHPNGAILGWYFSSEREGCRRYFVAGYNNTFAEQKTWPELYAAGYRIIPCTIAAAAR